MGLQLLGGLLGEVAGGIGAAARRGLIRNILPGMLARNISGAEALRQFRDAGLGIREADFYDIRREVLGLEQRQGRIKYEGADHIPTDATFDTNDYALPKRYRLISEVDYFDMGKREWTKGYMAMDTDRLGTIAEMEAEAESLYAEWYPDLVGVIRSVHFIKGFITPE